LCQELELNCFHHEDYLSITNIKNLRSIGYSQINENQAKWVRIRSKEAGQTYSSFTKVKAVNEGLETTIHVHQRIWMKMGGSNAKLIKVAIAMPKKNEVVDDLSDYILPMIMDWPKTVKRPKNIARIVVNVISLVGSIYTLEMPWKIIVPVVVFLLSILI